MIIKATGIKRINYAVFDVIFDDEQRYLAQYTWRVDQHGYAFRKAHGKRIYMHRFLMSEHTSEELVVDHINRNKLDNRLLNLRAVTRTVNAQNRGPHKKNGSGYRGVHWDRSALMWKASVRAGTTTVWSKYFHIAKEAAIAARDARLLLQPGCIELDIYDDCKTTEVHVN